MNCNCNDKAIIIVRGNDTNFNNGHFLTINLNTTILDLSTFKATFKLGSIFRQIDDISSGIISLDFTAAETSKLPQFCYGTLKLIDASNRVATIESLIPFQVISVVNGNAIATEPYTLNFDVKQQGETILNVSVESAVTVELGTTTTLPAGSDATVTNSGTGNHLILNFGIPRGADGSVLSVNGKTGDVVLDYTDVGANPLITDENMLNADLVDDTTAVHKFATAEELTQIETNKNDITALDNKYDSITGSLSDSITALDNKYDSVTGALDDKIDSINGALSDSITALDSVVSSNYTTLDGKIDSVNGALSDSITGLDTKYDSITGALDTKIDNHIGDTLNPHAVTKSQVGLGNCDNTSDANKPISTATQNALDSISGALSNEADIRQNADNGLQSQIDAIVVSSDVFDVVGTYAELQAYDIATVPVNDIIKVLVDSTHDNAATYYRCVENNNVKSWSYIGAEGAYYTKSEADGRFVPLTRTINNKALSSNITLTASDVGALPDNTTIGDATLTIQVNSSTVDTFTANATSNKSINIQCATPSQGTKADTALQPNDNITELTNNAGYITNSALSGYATETYVDTGLATKQDTLTEGSGIDISGGSTTVNPLVTLPLTVYETGTDKIFNASSTAYDGAVIYGKWDAGSVIVFSGDSTALSYGYGFYYSNNSIIAMARYTQQYSTLATISDIAYQSDFYYKIQFFQDGTIDMYYSLDGTTYELAVSTTTASGGALYGQDIYVCGGNNSVLAECSLSVPSGGATISCDNTIARVTDIPTNNNQLTNGAGYITSSALNGYATESFVTSQGYITGITGSDVTTALGYTPYNSTNPSGYITSSALTGYVTSTDLSTTLANYTLSSSLATVATTGSYDDLTDKPYIPSGVIVDQTYDATSQNAQSGVAIAGAGFLTGITSGDVTTALGYTPYNSTNPNGYITSSALANYMTTNTAQDVSGRKTFLGEKAIYFKQTATTDKLGFTLYNPSNTELGALEWRPSTINGNALLALNCPQAGSNYVGFRYWANINIVAPRPAVNGTYFIPVNITNGSTTVTATNTGTVNISSLMPTVNNATLTIQKNGTTVNTFTANASSDVTCNITVPTNTNELTNGAGFITSSSLPTKISDLTDDTASYPIDKADTLTGLTASITELNYVDGVTASIQTQLNNKLTTSDIVSNVSSSSTNSKAVGAKLFYDTCGDIETLINAL